MSSTAGLIFSTAALLTVSWTSAARYAGMSGMLERCLLQAWGSRALINGSDVRIGADRFGRAGQVTNANGHSCEVALVLGGFGRVRGNIASTFLARVLDEDDEPLGYDELRGVSLLFNPEQEAAYRDFPQQFRFKDAQRLYGTQATTDFLKKCIGVGVLRKDTRE